MQVSEIIYKKREGLSLSSEEIQFLIRGLTNKEVPDFQISAWLMAVYFQGLNDKELEALTEAMISSGETLDLSMLDSFTADKHSTGGVGDKTTLVLAPLLASCGIPIAKMSGRGLGHTGGTIDKLESIPGFRAELNRKEFIHQLEKIGLAITGQTGTFVPADKKLYELRDLTATVESIPLIASSIMSKKIAGGADGIILDIKVGSGAFIDKTERAEILGRIMVELGKSLGCKTKALITSMEQPLGRTVGNSLEVLEAVELLKGAGPEDLFTLTTNLTARILIMSGRVSGIQEGIEYAAERIQSGAALDKFIELIEAQGGDPRFVEKSSILPLAPYKYEIRAKKEGWIQKIDAFQIGREAVHLGAGRRKKGEEIDPGVGIVLKKKVQDKVDKGDILSVVYSSTKRPVKILSQIENAFSTGRKEVKAPDLILSSV